MWTDEMNVEEVACCSVLQGVRVDPSLHNLVDLLGHEDVGGVAPPVEAASETDLHCQVAVVVKPMGCETLALKYLW